MSLFYSYSYSDGFHIFIICGTETIFLVKTGEKIIFYVKTKGVYNLWQLLSFITESNFVFLKVRVEAEEPVED